MVTQNYVLHYWQSLMVIVIRTSVRLYMYIYTELICMYYMGG